MNACSGDMGIDGGRSNIGRIVAVATVVRTVGRVRADVRIMWGPSQGTNLIVRVFHAGVASNQDPNFGNGKKDPHYVDWGHLTGAQSYSQGRTRRAR